MQPSRLVQARRSLKCIFQSPESAVPPSAQTPSVLTTLRWMMCPELASCQVASPLMQIRDRSSESEATELPERLQTLARQASLGVISPVREQSWAGRAVV